MQIVSILILDTYQLAIIYSKLITRNDFLCILISTNSKLIYHHHLLYL